jgi:CRISPR/Cas system-associated exonuclease Cas4 (RecB family)
MGLGGFLTGLLTAEVSAANLKKLADFLVSRLGGKPMEISINYTKDGKEYKIQVTARNEEDLKNALQQAENFIKETES